MTPNPKTPIEKYCIYLKGYSPTSGCSLAYWLETKEEFRQHKPQFVKES